MRHFIGLSFLILVASIVTSCSSAVSTSMNATKGPPSSFKIIVPISGEHGKDWTISEYVDVDSSSGVRDYEGNEKSYNGHRGTDFAVANFRAMDNESVLILAAADGRVIATTDRYFDRNTADSIEESLRLPACRGGRVNYVSIAHDDGYRTLYSHLKKDSIRVDVGDIVTAGDAIGVVGSSGCSTGPHLHFEVYKGSKTVAPFKEGIWIDPPSYETPFGLMDYAVHDHDSGDLNRALFHDPPPNVDRLPLGNRLRLIVYLAGGKQGDVLGLHLSHNEESRNRESVFDDSFSSSYWYSVWNTEKPGDYLLEATLNGVELGINHMMTVE